MPWTPGKLGNPYGEVNLMCWNRDNLFTPDNSVECAWVCERVTAC